MKNENVWTADMKHYSRTLDKLIKMYKITTGLTKEEFRNRFWNEQVWEHLGCFQTYSILDQRLLNIYQRTDISEENKAMQQLAVAMGWKCKKLCRYLLWEIVHEMFYQIACIDKTKKHGIWQAKATPYKFVHPIYQNNRKEEY